MTLKLDDMQEMARDTIKEWVEREVRPVAVELDRTGEYPKALMKRAGELGLLGLSMPVEYGGSGMPAYMEQVLAYEVSKASPGLAMAIAVHGGCTRQLFFSATEDQKNRYLSKAVSGEIICANTAVDPAGGTNFGYEQTSCTWDGDDILVNVEMPYATNATGADLYLLDTRVDGVARSVLIERDENVVPGGYDMVGMRSAGLGSVSYSNIRVKPENILPEGGAPSGLYGTIWLTYACNFLGATEEVFDRTKEYILQRTRQGRPVGTFQGPAHVMAKAKVNIEAMRGIILNGIDHITSGNTDPVLDFSAKVFCQKTARETVAEMVELWGGVGIVEDAGVIRYMRDIIAAGPGEYPAMALYDCIAHHIGLDVDTQAHWSGSWQDKSYPGYNDLEIEA